MTRQWSTWSFILTPLLLWCALPLAAAENSTVPSEEHLKLIVGLLGDKDREFRAAALEQVRKGAKGTAATDRFASQLGRLDPDGQIALVSALADRGDVVAKPAVLDLFKNSKDEKVRASAVSALGQLGSEADLPLLIQELSAASGYESTAARRSLIEISGKSVVKTLAADSRSLPPQARVTVLDILTARRAADEWPTFTAAAVDDNPQVRRAAMNGFGDLGRPEQLAAMLPGVIKAERGPERDHAERKMTMVCSRIGNDDQRGAALIDAIDKIPESERDALLPLIGRVGGKKLAKYVIDIASSPDAARRRIGIDALSKWPDASVADTLFEIATKATDAAERTQAFQAFVKNASTRDNHSDKERLGRMKEAMKVAKTPEEQTFVINRTRTAYDVDAVRFVLPYVDQSQFAPIACETIVEIAHHREVRDPNKEEFDKVLDKVIATSKDPVVVDRAQRYKRGETWVRPK